MVNPPKYPSRPDDRDPIADSMSRVTRRFRIEGKVQGVYFRHSTRGEAERLAIAGYARNLPDGSVEVLAHGSVPAVEELLVWLHRGPRGARVDSVAELTVELEPPRESEPAFEVR
jgi:acylphosphatase